MSYTTFGEYRDFANAMPESTRLRVAAPPNKFFARRAVTEAEECGAASMRYARDFASTSSPVGSSTYSG